MILQYIFSMAISTNLLAMLLLFSVSVKFELALPISPSLQKKIFGAPGKYRNGALYICTHLDQP